MKLISVVTPCYNEEDNVQECVKLIQSVFSHYDNYTYEHIFIDNASTDKTLDILRDIASTDKHVKVIANSRNFGHIRSPYHGLLQAHGDAVILFVADLQDPASLIPEFIKKWEEGFQTVVGTKRSSEESSVMFTIRKLYYKTVNRLSNIDLIDNFTGFGLYDKEVIDHLRSINDPYPYFRGLIAEIGLRIHQIPYDQPVRVRGITKNNFFTLYDIGMLGIISHSQVPLRIATMAGFLLSFISIFIAAIYFLLKLIFWNSFSLGMAPVVIGIFFFASVQLFFVGILGEYLGSIHIYSKRRPLVIEKERINF
ncbi:MULTISPECIES: glycosyltransferase family 2 protein [Cellvibrio]|jgi:glycosyltransferase involved in cell wall biosynthesis|uniref:Glycosyltransferase involved in cell wall biosynthesis n=1 Tax=Cellvibrio fibrivorans TaxID=126350 RepID=A0ABU1V116_9GAMM|nr:glycosyltransferase family 2 protein [Cellvibrio fibrivorans]MDR7091072.1 glycosyltransferase involved in cell wall biosynthesis [Cellvibrio fibrivorans]